MIFNSLPFLLFFLAFFLLYWSLPNRNPRQQNMLLLLGSFFFYGWWDWHFLFLLAFSTTSIFLIGIQIEKQINPRGKKIFLNAGLILIIGLLFVFKYFNFFVSSFIALLVNFSVHSNLKYLNFVLPLGISFYSFKLVGYLLDVYHNKFNASTNWVTFSMYTAFFPSLISGPIDKATLLMPQLETPRRFNYAQACGGIRQILWGLFKKAVIADNLAPFTNQIFDHYGTYSGSTLMIGVILYAMQLYTDFSGYSDMAIGIARLLGIEITKNFDFPFFSQNIAEFWRKWHISLTAWLTEYIFTPLNIHFRDLGKTGLILAIIINFTICGIWHGANWTYVLFGVLHGCYFIPLIIRGRLFKRVNKNITETQLTLRVLFNMTSTFLLVSLTWVFFRADTVRQAFQYITRLFSLSFFHKPEIFPVKSFLLISIFMTVEWIGRGNNYAIENLDKKLVRPMRWAIYYGLILTIFYFSGKEEQFIYFQF
jgi:alginate O-acetyltransferase complex protein AlgI